MANTITQGNMETTSAAALPELALSYERIRSSRLKAKARLSRASFANDDEPP